MPSHGWSPEERAGQRLVGGFEGTSPPASLIDRVRRGRLGGVILFRRNIESAPQLLELTHRLQEAAAAAGRPPLLIAIDQEGGRVSRLPPDFTVFPPAALFGRLGDPALAAAAARATGAELRASGVNLNFAPVLDLRTHPGCTVIGDRAYGDDPSRVGELAAAVIAGLQSEGVAACAKHFPGIGGMAPDPHETLPASGLSPERLRERELAPFRRVLAPDGTAGGPAGRAASVMVAHAVYEGLDPERPASLSPAVIGGLLRGEMGYAGLVVTDDLEMGAIADPVGAARASLAAGADIALICRSEEIQERALEAIASALRAGDIPPREEDASLQRVGDVKSRFAGRSGEEATAGPGRGPLGRLRERQAAVVGCAAHRALRERLPRLDESPDSG